MATITQVLHPGEADFDSGNARPQYLNVDATNTMVPVLQFDAAILEECYFT
jgi:hypothetical protein